MDKIDLTNCKKITSKYLFTSSITLKSYNSSFQNVFSQKILNSIQKWWSLRNYVLKLILRILFLANVETYFEKASWHHTERCASAKILNFSSVNCTENCCNQQWAWITDLVVDQDWCLFKNLDWRFLKIVIIKVWSVDGFIMKK